PLFLCVFLFFSVFSVWGLSLDEAVSLAIENNLNLQRQQIDLAASSFSERNLWSEIFPTINANATAGYSNNLFGTIQPSGSGIRYSIGLGLNLGLNAGIPYVMRNIRLAHQSDILRYDDAVNQLSIQVTRRFYALLADQNNLLLLEEILNLALRQFNRSEISFQNGLVGELSVLQSRLALENARFNLSAAQTAHLNNRAEFFAALGITPDPDIELLGEINIVRIEADSEFLVREHLDSRPDIVRNTQEIERLANLQRQTVMQNRAPNLNLSVNWGSSAFDPFADSISATASLNIPIDSWIPGTSRGQAVSRAADSVEKARLDLAMTRDSAKTQIRTLTALLRNSWDNILIARLGFDVAQRTFQLTEQGFLNGTVEALVLEDTRNNMANASQRVLITELAYLNMILDLSAALNVDWKNLINNFGVTGE
ncbi:MAG: TolC family protein, partial [Treponema sp.]|nr:TolC family protein [Treponema sp.]